jgi:hypothetical protein
MVESLRNEPANNRTVCFRNGAGKGCCRMHGEGGNAPFPNMSVPTCI